MAAQPQREWFEKDYYKVLGVPETATDKEIRRAYRKLAKEHHPDSNPGHEETFKEISAAYDVLSDDEKRKAYDEVRRLGPMAGGFGPGAGGFGTGGPGAGGFTFTTEDVGDLGGLGDLFGNLFGGGAGAVGRRLVPAGGTISRPSCTCRSSTPSMASPPRSTSPARWPATRVTAAAPPPARRRSCARRAVAAAPSRTIRARSRSAGRARAATDGARSSSPRARRATAAA